MADDRTALIIFVRNPEPGKVKTRLARAVGSETALQIYQRLLDHTREIVAGVDADKFVFYSEYVPANDEWLSLTERRFVQSGTDLGASGSTLDSSVSLLR